LDVAAKGLTQQTGVKVFAVEGGLAVRKESLVDFALANGYVWKGMHAPD
jgi:hypothetical protein